MTTREVTVTVDPPAQGYVPGDLDGDRRVTVADAIRSHKLIAGLVPASDLGRSGADVDCDGQADVRDVLLLLRRVAGLVGGLDCA